ncbi:ANTAR domain-containing protein [Arthrobacter sp. P2b]|nr:ANTAR domain-containing protein [Arthrobacter sp. P2b]
MTPEQRPPMMELQNLLISAESVEDFFCGLSGVAAATLSGRTRSTIDCGITFQEGSRRVTVAGSSPRAVRLDQIEQRLGQGPCVEALRTLAPVLLEDVASDPRWPSYQQELASQNCRSVLGMPLHIGRDSTAALNFFASGRVFDDQTIKETAAFAGAASQAIRLVLKIKDAQNTVSELRSALESQTPVSIACGILMAQNRCSQDEAMTILTNASKASDKTRQDLAKEIVTHLSGETPATFFQS